LRRDPLAHAVVEAGLAVERGGHLHPDPGRLADHAAEEADVEFARFLSARPDLDIDARGAQPLEALAGDQRIGVGDRCHDPANAGCDQRIATWAGAAMVGAGFERDVRGRADDRMAPRRRIAQCHDLGMRAADLLGVALADHRAVRSDQDAADARIRIGLGPCLAREIQCLDHEIRIFFCHSFVKSNLFEVSIRNQLKTIGR
jgi:hypothetical protein